LPVKGEDDVREIDCRNLEIFEKEEGRTEEERPH
jgi:hypothetical protein